ncbi:MAG: SpoIIE family protein phosphatase [Sphaerochaetaceae bacterium]|nr:SpoIIE family protein phosphatase [Sphaerochaetaceae bacterium]
MNDIYIDADYYQIKKNGEAISGDVILLSRDRIKHQIVCTLSDGLGSGIKANVIASMASHMAHNFCFSPVGIIKGSEITMNTLPVCKERGIGYSTFTLADIRFSSLKDNTVRIVEYDNPQFLFFNKSEQKHIDREKIILNRSLAFKKEILYESNIVLDIDDRVIIFSDGMTQSGLGTNHPLGFRREGVAAFVAKEIKKNPDISSRSLSKALALKAASLDNDKPKDDITVLVIHARHPRKTLFVSGPPYTMDNDIKLKKKIENFDGKIIVAGGTTSKIVSRVLNREMKADLSCVSKDIPPTFTMEGIDIVSEGMLTLNAVLKVLEEKLSVTALKENAVKKISRLLLDSDQIHFIIGTKLNEAHQDPSIPFDIGIRRTIVNRIIKALDENFMKLTTIEYL